MADIHCPMCGKSNPEKLDVCQFCGARLKPMVGSSANDPIQKDGSGSEKGKPSNVEPIRPGVAPTRKDTGELEKALPDWLRSLREGQDSSESPAEEEADESASLPPLPGSKPSSSTDLLAGFSHAASEEEEGVPDWLAALRGGKPDEPAAPSEPESAPSSEWGNADWMSRLDEKSQGGETKNKNEEVPAGETSASFEPTEETPDWIKALQVSRPTDEPAEGDTLPPKEKMPDWFSNLPEIPAEEEASSDKSAEPAGRDKVPDWLAQLQESNAQAPQQNEPAGEPGEPAQEANLPDWLDKLQEKNSPAEPPTNETGNASTPDWLSGQPSESEAAAPAAEEKLPDWLNTLSSGAEAPAAEGNVPDWLSGSQEGSGSEPETPAAPVEKIPDWLSDLKKNAPAAPEAAAEENVPDWLSSAEEKTAAAAETPAAAEKGELPDWLSRLEEQTVQAAETGEEPKASQAAAAETPDWLNDIEKAAPPVTEQPALPESNQEQGSEAFSAETPEWLSKVEPQQTAEKNGAEEAQAGAANLEAGALPTWVQAMRPLESVVNDKAGNLRDEQVAEQSGPLAGLVGVLPAGPGLGSIRKPPTYSVKLQLSEIHQRYMEHFDQLIADETKPREARTTRLTSHFLWRIVITVFLLAAVLLPFLTQAHFIPAPSGISSGDTPYSASGVSRGATATIIAALPANAPVLVAFDYEPALSSELEAVSAPLIDQLMTKGARLAIVSTSPTGPALAEQFLQTASLVNSHQYQAGQQYIDLGYLAGGPAAISTFAASPSQAMPYSLDGKPAWGTPVLQGVSNLNDFSAVFVLTDSAEIGRNWVEQAGQSLGSTPMVMVISAQAEPMVRPYFDSGQLKGLVSGLMDAMIYEADYNRPGLANHYWDAYSLGVLAAEVLIVIGAAWGAIGSWRSRQKSHREEASHAD